MKTYTIKLEMTVAGVNNPLDAAKRAVKTIIKDGNKMIFDVEDDITREKFSVDLDDEDENAVLPI